MSSQITDSRNLNQKANNIHWNAMTWKQNLDRVVLNQLSKSEVN